MVSRASVSGNLYYLAGHLHRECRNLILVRVVDLNGSRLLPNSVLDDFRLGHHSGRPLVHLRPRFDEAVTLVELRRLGVERVKSLRIRPGTLLQPRNLNTPNTLDLSADRLASAGEMLVPRVD